MIDANTHPSRLYVAEQSFYRSWHWLTRHGYVNDSEAARDYAFAELTARDWPALSAALLCELSDEFTRTRRQ